VSTQKLHELHEILIRFKQHQLGQIGRLEGHKRSELTRGQDVVEHTEATLGELD